MKVAGVKAPCDSNLDVSLAPIPTALKTIPAEDVVRSCPEQAVAQYVGLF